ncbi:hypothetical protein LNQ81_05630 [Myroides sp. M-43]|uniref:hypothetical protein n=1 Tax=Myroides oncorhynchi TaxID=2893756 RepID=UPI001E6177AE|nr:hypothetical protein [Myroides oncorhynchi]MCC9042172.1 hypothetical protein [Myroides oncorhynchi]
MKKIFLLMLVAVLGLTATSCSKDDDIVPNKEEGIQEAWRLVNFSYLNKDRKRISGVIPAINDFNWKETELFFRKNDGRQTRFEKGNKGEDIIINWDFDYHVKDNQLLMIDKKLGLNDLEIYTIDEITKSSMYIRYHTTPREVQQSNMPRDTEYILYYYRKM